MAVIPARAAAEYVVCLCGGRVGVTLEMTRRLGQVISTENITVGCHGAGKIGGECTSVHAVGWQSWWRNKMVPTSSFVLGKFS